MEKGGPMQKLGGEMEGKMLQLYYNIKDNIK